MEAIRSMTVTVAISAILSCARPVAGPRGAAAETKVVPQFVDLLASPGAPPSLSGRPALADLLRIALERSPVIAAARERVVAAREGAAAAGWLPDPTVSIGWYETSVETRVGPQEWSVGVRQAIPFPTKLATQSDIAEQEARRLDIAYQIAVRNVLADVVATAYELSYLDDATRISAEIEPLVERYVAAAAGDAGLVSELFRADTQRAQLNNDRVLLAELRAVEAQRLRSILALPVTTSIGTPIVPAPPAVDATFDELVAVAERHSQELAAAGVVVEAARLRESLARQRRLPDFTLGVTHIDTDELDRSLGLDPPGNGDDPLIVQLGLSIPLWAPRDAAAIRQAEALTRAAALDEAHVVERTRELVARAWFDVGKASRLSDLYDTVLVPRAAVAARTAEDLISAGKGSVGGALETIAVLHNFRLAAARARADHAQAIATLERAIGRPFDADGGTP